MFLFYFSVIFYPALIISTYFQFRALRIKEYLTRPYEEGGLYDYFNRPFASNLREDLDQIAQDFFSRGKKPLREYETLKKEVFQKDYHKMIGQCLKACALLEDNGYSRNNIVFSLLTEHPHRWFKVAKRILTKKKSF